MSIITTLVIAACSSVMSVLAYHHYAVKPTIEQLLLELQLWRLSSIVLANLLCIGLANRERRKTPANTVAGAKVEGSEAEERGRLGDMVAAKMRMMQASHATAAAEPGNSTSKGPGGEDAKGEGEDRPAGAEEKAVQKEGSVAESVEDAGEAEVESAQPELSEEWTEHLKDLMEMGFDEAVAQVELARCDGNVRLAVKALVATERKAKA